MEKKPVLSQTERIESGVHTCPGLLSLGLGGVLRPEEGVGEVPLMESSAALA